MIQILIDVENFEGKVLFRVKLLKLQNPTLKRKKSTTNLHLELISRILPLQRPAIQNCPFSDYAVRAFQAN